jgi:tetratricopeptide (TPR) repeat protein
LRRVTFSQITGIGAAVLIVCSFLSYQRATVWASPVALWQDAVEKSPGKYRPQFQLAYAEFSAGQFAQAIKDYEAASKLAPITDELLVDWGLAIASAGRPNEAIDKFHDAEKINNTAHVHTQIAAAYGQQKKYEEARAELMQAMAIDQNYDVTYAYLGSVEESEGNRDAARANYHKALKLNPQDLLAQQGLARLGP